MDIAGCVAGALVIAIAMAVAVFGLFVLLSREPRGDWWQCLSTCRSGACGREHKKKKTTHQHTYAVETKVFRLHDVDHIFETGRVVPVEQEGHNDHR
jgi:hypothetical protein